MNVNELKAMIGIKIYTIRTENNLTQSEFLNKLESYTSRGHLSKIERGEIMPSAEFIREVCLKFNVSSNWLLGIERVQNFHSLTSTDVELIRLFKNTTQESQELLFKLLKQLQILK